MSLSLPLLLLLSAAPPRSLTATSSTVPAQHVELRLAGGVLRGGEQPGQFFLGAGGYTGMFGLYWGLSDRLQLSLLTPALALRLGERGATEWIPWAGVTQWSLRGQFGGSTPWTLSAELGAGLDARWWVSESQSFTVGLSAFSPSSWNTQGGSSLLQVWQAEVGAAYTYQFGELLSLNLGLNVRNNTPLGAIDVGGSGGGGPLSLSLGLGSVRSVGVRPLPLVQLHLSERFTLDGYASLVLDVPSLSLQQSYLAGFTWSF